MLSDITQWVNRLICDTGNEIKARGVTHSGQLPFLGLTGDLFDQHLVNDRDKKIARKRAIERAIASEA
jgi:hypothetical protein